ncbi:MAG TPA: hypothetical protein DIT98_14075, partial [Verrucomicrobiales bacterium]|nr:hypothetical protein [Verrucomicrobiales bacterium]
MQSIVAAEDDWGVMAGHHLELADSRITDHFDNTGGSGLVVINEDESSAYQATNSCSPSTLASRVGTTNTDLGLKVWPTLKRGLPLTSLFEKDQLIDRQDGQTRIWSFDDSASDSIDPDEQPSSASFHAQCTDSPVCTRLADSDTFSIPSGVEIDSANNTITIDGGSICKGQSGVECHLYVEHLNLNNT